MSFVGVVVFGLFFYDENYAMVAGDLHLYADFEVLEAFFYFS